MIGTSTDSETLGRFLYGFRRALLRHRKSRMAFLFAIRFPDADQGDFEGESEPDKLDFRNWLDSAPPAEIGGNSLYRQLQAVQAKFIRLADAAVATSRNRMLIPEQYAEMLRLMLRLDVLADRLASGITTAMTDLDALTGLLNRSAMERDLAQVQAATRGGGQTFTVAMVDADHFKQVNDTHGHAFGDIVLQTLAERFVESLRPRDQVYRYGGEEFLLLFPDTDLIRAWPVLERLRQRASAEPIGEGEVKITITVSVGATIVIVGEEDMKTALERADAALYEAKQAGRNRVLCDPPITTTPEQTGPLK
jgi:diguanylate cyclase (GGDEF)-like protein